jgi:hypothetical protein
MLTNATRPVTVTSASAFADGSRCTAIGWLVASQGRVLTPAKEWCRRHAAVRAPAPLAML